MAQKKTTTRKKDPNHWICGQTHERNGTDWESLLVGDEKGMNEEANKPVVFLRGLQRLAQLAGITSSYPTFSPIIVGPKVIMQCVYFGEFSDTTKWAAAADATEKNNTAKPFCYFPTAMAESRAESRMLRKALGIATLSAEELPGRTSVGEPDIEPEGSIDEQIVRTINDLLQTADIAQIDLFRNVLDSDRQKEVFDVGEFTVAEGHVAMRFLNGEHNTKTNRDRRKATLAKRIKESDNASS